eukprot:3829611-Pyramimonas_sp.AAC.1
MHLALVGIGAAVHDPLAGVVRDEGGGVVGARAGCVAYDVQLAPLQLFRVGVPRHVQPEELHLLAEEVVPVHAHQHVHLPLVDQQVAVLPAGRGGPRGAHLLPDAGGAVEGVQVVEAGAVLVHPAEDEQLLLAPQAHGMARAGCREVPEPVHLRNVIVFVR